MNHNKKIIIALGIIFSIILLSLSILKISVNILYPGNELSNILKESFKDIFGKAVKFDSFYFQFNGNIKLINFYLSNTNDFNDNINLIKCDEVTIDTSLFDLIRKKITFSGVYMIEPEVTIVKNYGKSYYEIFVEDLIGGINREKMKQFITDGFRFELIDSKVSLRETFKNSKTSIEIYDADFKIKYKKDLIRFRSFGYIQDRIRKSWFKSSYRFIGETDLEKNLTETSIELKNFDVNHLNNFINENTLNRLFISGTLSGKVKLTGENDIIKCKGGMDISALNLFYYEDENPYPLFKNESIDTEFIFTLSKKFDKITFEKLDIDDGILKLTTAFDYIKDDYFSLQLKSKKINLGDLSNSVFIFRNCSYEGDMLFSVKCRYNLKEEKPDDIGIDLQINNFSIFPIKKEVHDYTNIKNCNIFLSADKDRIDLKTNFKTGNSDIDMFYKSQISSWKPVKSSTSLEIKSRQLEFDLLKKIFTAAVKKVYSLAYVDMFQNFDEHRNFLKEPEGIFINDNDISLKLSADSLMLTSKAHLNNMKLDLSLIKGIIKTNSFTLDGYDGKYTFNFYSTMHQDYPYFKFDAGVTDLNLNRISDDSPLGYSFGGIMNLGMNLEISDYRIGQVIENGKAGINIAIKNGYFTGTSVQKKINDFLVNKGYKNIPGERVDFSSFSLSLLQSGNNFYVKNFMMTGPNVNFSSYGKYTDEEGLKVPFNVNIISDKVIEKAPLYIEGKLEAPCIKIQSKTKSEPVCF
jgi:hypothetical protein